MPRKSPRRRQDGGVADNIFNDPELRLQFWMNLDDDDTAPAAGPPAGPPAGPSGKYNTNLDSIITPLVTIVQDNINLYEQLFTATAATAAAGKGSPTEDEIYNFFSSLTSTSTPAVTVLPLLTAVYTQQSADKSEVKTKLADPVISELATYLATELKKSITSLTETETAIAFKIKAVIDSKKDVLAQAIWAELPDVITRIKTMYDDAAATAAGTAGPTATAVLLDLAELKASLQSMLKSDVNIETINDGGGRRKFRRSDGRKPKRSDGRRKYKKRSDGKKGKGKRKSPKYL